jgi:hypothetical protein
MIRLTSAVIGKVRTQADRLEGLEANFHFAPTVLAGAARMPRHHIIKGQRPHERIQLACTFTQAFPLSAPWLVRIVGSNAVGQYCICWMFSARSGGDVPQ